jgi:hypothetical protein
LRQFGQELFSGKAIENTMQGVKERLAKDSSDLVTRPIDCINIVLIDAQDVLVLHEIAKLSCRNLACYHLLVVGLPFLRGQEVRVGPGKPRNLGYFA